MLRKYVNLRTFFNPENWIADKTQLFPRLVTVELRLSLSLIPSPPYSPLVHVLLRIFRGGQGFAIFGRKFEGSPPLGVFDTFHEWGFDDNS